MTAEIDPTVPYWPRCLAPRSISWGPSRPVLAGPQPLSGRPQTVLSDMGSWRVSLSNIRLHDQYGDKVRTLRALLFGILAQGGSVYLPMYDWRRNPRARNGLPALPPGVPYSDGTGMSDGSLFAGDDASGITIVDGANARATEITIISTGDPLPMAGEFIGLGDRAHVVAAVFSDDLPAGTVRMRIWPPLRAPAGVGDVVRTIDPICRMQLDPKSFETAVTLDLAIVGNISLDFYESNWAYVPFAVAPPPADDTFGVMDFSKPENSGLVALI